MSIKAEEKVDIEFAQSPEVVGGAAQPFNLGEIGIRLVMTPKPPGPLTMLDTKVEI